METTQGNLPYVVGVDGSDRALRAIRWAVEAARLHNAPLTLVHALAIPDLYIGALPPLPELRDGVREHGQNVLDEAARHAAALGATDVNTELRDDRASVVLRAASRTARAVVLGASAHGRTSDTLVHGALSAQLAAHADCPVVAVRGEEPADEAPVVVGVDGSPLSEHALATAFEEASFRRSPLLAVHAWDNRTAEGRYPGTELVWPPMEQVERQLLSERLAGWSEKYPDVAIRREVVQERPGHALVELSRTARLVVVGSRGFGGFTGLLLGSTSQKLIYHAECPVMIVRPDKTE